MRSLVDLLPAPTALLPTISRKFNNPHLDIRAAIRVQNNEEALHLFHENNQVEEFGLKMKEFLSDDRDTLLNGGDIHTGKDDGRREND